MLFQHLNLNINPLKDTNIFEKFPLHKSAKYKLPNSEISEEMIDFMKSFGAVYWEVELFTSAKNYILLPHTDDCYLGDYAKINFVYCEDDNHTMDWYDAIDEPEIVKPNYDDTKEGDAHFRYSLENTKLIASERINVALVNVGVPHGITTKSRRQCLSFIITLEIDGVLEDLTMSNCPELLHKHFL